MSNKDDKQILIRTAAVEDAPQLLNIYAQNEFDVRCVAIHIWLRK